MVLWGQSRRRRGVDTEFEYIKVTDAQTAALCVTREFAVTQRSLRGPLDRRGCAALYARYRINDNE